MQPVWLVYAGANIVAWFLFWAALRRFGPTHVASVLALADIAGGFTVCASVTVSSFLFEKIIAKGLVYVALEPAFWLCILVLALTGVIQV